MQSSFSAWSHGVHSRRLHNIAGMMPDLAGRAGADWALQTAATLLTYAFDETLSIHDMKAISDGVLLRTSMLYNVFLDAPLQASHSGACNTCATLILVNGDLSGSCTQGALCGVAHAAVFVCPCG